VTGFSTGTMRFFTWVNIADMQLGECDSPLHLGVFFDPAVNIADMQLGECDLPLHLTFPRHIFVNNRLLIFLEALYLLLLDGNQLINLTTLLV
jgi:hypothetical protein